MMFVLASLRSNAIDVTLQWDPSPDETVIGYRVYLRQVGLGKIQVVETGYSFTKIYGLVEGSTYLIHTTAFTAENVESEPSNQVLYTVPAAAQGVGLMFAGFSHAEASHSPRGGLGAFGEMYLEGTEVTLAATTDDGYVCDGWIVNAALITGNPIQITVDRHTVVSPLIKRADGLPLVEQPATEISLRMLLDSEGPQLSIGGELGPWVLEGSNSLVQWMQIAAGVTSQRIPILTKDQCAFYRVRPVDLAQLNY